MAAFPRGPGVVFRFALYAAAALAVAVTIGALLARTSATARAEERVSDEAWFVADRLGRDDLARLAFAAPAGADVRAQLDELMDRAVLGPDVLRVTLFAPDGTITYSTHHPLIGRSPERPRLVARAAGGEGAHGAATLRGGAADGRKVLESFVPVHSALADSAHASGVLAISRDYGPVAAEIRDEFLVQATVIAVALVLLYALLIPIVRRLTRRLRASEARYRALTEQASDGIFVCDEDARILEVNPRLCELLADPPEMLLTRRVHDLIAPEDLAALPLRLPEMRRGGRVQQTRQIIRGDGTRFLGEFSGVRLEDGRYYASLRDITERQRLERELWDAQKAEAVGRLAAAASREFELVVADLADAAHALRAGSGSDALERLDDAVADGARLARRLLEIGHEPELRPETLDVNEAVARIEHELRRRLAGGMTLDVRYGSGLGAVAVDPHRLEQVVRELVLAARDASGGGTITLTTAAVDFARRSHQRPADGSIALDSGHYVMLAVHAEGAGREHDALTLALATVLGIVERSGGTAGVESDPSTGTTVRLYLRRVASAELRQTA